ncbi:MAG: carbonic anhydrase family protein [Verrucomicrobiota bacterium]
MKKLTILAIVTLIAGVATQAHARSLGEQKSMTPAQVLEELMEGNERFQNGHGTHRDLLNEAEETSTGQYPIAVVVSCLDSRVPVELVFDQGIGDIFVGRVAGNVEDRDMVGSLEFATKVAGSKLIMVMGHESCGAVKGAIDDVELGNLTQLLDKIDPAIESVGTEYGSRSSKNAKYVDAVIRANVLNTIDDIREISPIIAEMEKNGDIMIVGTMYSLDDGAVTIVK